MKKKIQRFFQDHFKHVTISLAMALGVVFAVSTFAASRGFIQGESMMIEPTIITDSSASGGKTLAMLNNQTATGTISTSGSANTVSLRVRADQCEGAPKIKIIVDGNVDGIPYPEQSVSNTGWKQLQVALGEPLAAGSHKVRIKFLNDFQKPGTCDRNVYIDKVDISEVDPKEYRDNRRKSNLDTYKQALNKFQTDKAVYPMSYVVAMSASSQPFSSLSPNYMDIFFEDPRAPIQHYYYIGSANQFAVCADLETAPGNRWVVSPTTALQESGAASGCSLRN